MDDDWDPLAELSRLDLIVVRCSIWWHGLWWRYCSACDQMHRPWHRVHRSCRCGLSQPDEWDQDDRDAFRAVIAAAVRAAEEEERRG